MRRIKLLVVAVVLVFISAACVFICCNKEDNNTVAVSPTDDSSQFVTLTDAVPDAILEIRYFGTYNFVGTRIDGYFLHPAARLRVRRMGKPAECRDFRVLFEG